MLHPITYSVLLDCTRGGSQAAVCMMQNDTLTRKISIRLTQSGKDYPIPDNCTATIRGIKKDETSFFNACEVADGAAIYDVTSQTLAEAGTVLCQLDVTDPTGARLVSPQFSIVVGASLYSDSAVESTNEFTALQAALASVLSGTIKSITINASKHLIMTFNDNSVKDLGAVVGADGTSPSVSVGSVTTGEAGTEASVTNSGTSSAVVLDFVIPRGEDGDRASTSWSEIEAKPTTLSGFGITDGVSACNGTLQNVLSASATPCETAAVRNIYAGTQDMIPGETYLPTGAVYFVYE